MNEHTSWVFFTEEVTFVISYLLPWEMSVLEINFFAGGKYLLAGIKR